jgi:hypothetical protein
MADGGAGDGFGFTPVAEKDGSYDSRRTPPSAAPQGAGPTLKAERPWQLRQSQPPQKRQVSDKPPGIGLPDFLGGDIEHLGEGLCDYAFRDGIQSAADLWDTFPPVFVKKLREHANALEKAHQAKTKAERTNALSKLGYSLHSFEGGQKKKMRG